MTAPSMALGGLLTLATGVVVDGLPHLSGSDWAIVLWLAVINTAFAFTLWNHTLRSLTAIGKPGTGSPAKIARTR